MASVVIHQRRGWPLELFPFNAIQRKAQASMYIIRALRSRSVYAWPYLFRCAAPAVCVGSALGTIDRCQDLPDPSLPATLRSTPAPGSITISRKSKPGRTSFQVLPNQDLANQD